MSSVLYIFIGLLYFTCLSFLFRWLNHRSGKPTEAKWLVLAFAAKVIAGFAYGYVYAHIFEVSDSWVYFRESQQMHRQLLNDPAGFLKSGIQYNHAGDFFSTASDAFWSNLGENLLIKLLAVFNIFSGSNYYISSIFFNALSFLGLYFIFRVTVYYEQQHRLLLFFLIFFLPSCLFWNSGIDKDGLLVFFTGVLMYAVHRCISLRCTVKYAALGVLSFLAVMLLRNANAVLLIPAIAAWWLSSRSNTRPVLWYLGVYAAGGLLFFLTVFLPDAFNLPLRLAEKQHGFLSHEANTVLPLMPLQPALDSYCRVFPQAVNHVFLRPYITEIKSPFHLMAFAEVMLILLLIAFSVITARKSILGQFNKPYFLFLTMVALSGLLLIGYTVPFPGAIVRYKALYVVFLLIPFVSTIRVKSK